MSPESSPLFPAHNCLPTAGLLTASSALVFARSSGLVITAPTTIFRIIVYGMNSETKLSKLLSLISVCNAKFPIRKNLWRPKRAFFCISRKLINRAHEEMTMTIDRVSSKIISAVFFLFADEWQRGGFARSPPSAPPPTLTAGGSLRSSACKSSSCRTSPPPNLALTGPHRGSRKMLSRWNEEEQLAHIQGVLNAAAAAPRGRRRERVSGRKTERQCGKPVGWFNGGGELHLTVSPPPHTLSFFVYRTHTHTHTHTHTVVLV